MITQPKNQLFNNPTMTTFETSDIGQNNRNGINFQQFFDTYPIEEFADITAMSANICDVPYASICIFDGKQNHFKSCHGIDSTEINLDPSLGEACLESKDSVFIISDLRKDERFSNLFSTIQNESVIFFGAVPLITNNGYVLGILSIIDIKPRKLANNHISALKTLGKQIIHLFELRKSSILLENAFSNLYAINNDLQSALKEIKQYKTAIDSAAIVSITDTKGKITYVNDSFCAISGYTSDELIGQNQNIVNSNYHSKEFWKKMWKTIESGKIWHDHVRNISKNGKLNWMETTIVPFMDEKTNKPYQYISIRKDITEQKNIEQAEIQSIIFSHEIDRDNFAEDLHEGLAQRLVAINLHAQMVHAKIELLDDPKLNESINFIMEQVIQSIETSRNMAIELMPRSMMTEGLVPSIENYLSILRMKYSIEINLQSTFIENSRPSKSIEITIYRTIVSLLNKAIQCKLIHKINIAISQEPTIKCKIKVFCSNNPDGLKNKPLPHYLEKMEQLKRRTELNGGRISTTYNSKEDVTEIELMFE